MTTSTAPAAPQSAAKESEIKPGAPRTRELAVRVNDLRKRYATIEAVAGISFEINAGEVFGLLGPNGAGKTTTISVIATRLKPSSGEAIVFGCNVTSHVASVRHLIGFTPQDLSLYPGLTALENIKFFGRMYGVPRARLNRRADELLELVGLEGRRDDEVDTFSGGMKRRLNLAVSLVHEPKLLLLDEPTVGIDAQSRERIFSIVQDLRDQGTAILYSTHYMEEAERLCDRMAIMDEGKIIAMGTLDTLLGTLDCNEIIDVRGLPPDIDLSHLRQAPGVDRVEFRDHSVRMFVKNATQVLTPIQQAIGRVDGVHIEISRFSLEMLFLQLTGKELRD